MITVMSFLSLLIPALVLTLLALLPGVLGGYYLVAGCAAPRLRQAGHGIAHAPVQRASLHPVSLGVPPRNPQLTFHNPAGAGLRASKPPPRLDLWLP